MYENHTLAGEDKIFIEQNIYFLNIYSNDVKTLMNEINNYKTKQLN